MEEWLYYEYAKLENERPEYEEQIQIITQVSKLAVNVPYCIFFGETRQSNTA